MSEAGTTQAREDRSGTHPQHSYTGETPEAAVQAFIDGFCRPNELDGKSYTYRDRTIEGNPGEYSHAAYAFSFTRKELSRDVAYREYEGAIYETPEGYEVRHWESDLRGDERPPKPPGETPRRLQGRRPRDRRY